MKTKTPQRMPLTKRDVEFIDYATAIWNEVVRRDAKRLGLRVAPVRVAIYRSLKSGKLEVARS